MFSCVYKSCCYHIKSYNSLRNHLIFCCSTMASEATVDLKDKRVPYKSRNELLLEKDIVKEPIKLFEAWFKEASNTPGIIEPNAMFIATSSKSGIPSGRMVLLKSFGNNGFVFFTNYNSRKGIELAENPNASLAFYWEPLKRSVRIEGHVEKTSEKESDDYFHSRPYASKIGALASDQSKPCESRDQMSKITEELKQKYSETDHVPRPKHWGGYVVIPKVIEFWQGQSDRVHDRIVFSKPTPGDPLGEYLHEGEDGWKYQRLFP
uniref:pyridoxal 5'-phosphate synthase n=1 Tax=Cacopsylla melanoneura TaxID=428564 RepID=A0A8D8WB09_9HEMI